MIQPADVVAEEPVRQAALVLSWLAAALSVVCLVLGKFSGHSWTKEMVAGLVLTSVKWLSSTTSQVCNLSQLLSHLPGAWSKNHLHLHLMRTFVA